jgi:hypothetical protein
MKIERQTERNTVGRQTYRQENENVDRKMERQTGRQENRKA